MKTTAFAAALAGATLLAGAASAATVTYTDAIPMTATDWSDTMSVQQFDPLMGVLNSASVTLSGNIQGFIEVTNNNANTATLNMTLRAAIDALFGTSTLQINLLPQNAQTVTVAAGATYNTGTLTAADTDTLVVTGADLAAFQGTGTYDFAVSSVGSSAFSGASRIDFYSEVDAETFISVTYDYTPAVAPVPLPASALLLAGGVAGFGALRRRRKAA